jgi:hypothetical protein
MPTLIEAQTEKVRLAALAAERELAQALAETPYQQRFDLGKTAEAVIARTWPTAFNDSLTKALAIAR